MPFCISLDTIRSIIFTKVRNYFLTKDGTSPIFMSMFTLATVTILAGRKAAWRADAVAEGGFY